MPNTSSNEITDIGSTSSRGTTLVMESSESTRSNTNWYHIWALLAILLDYVSIIFNVFPVNTTLENSSSNSPSMISNGNSVINNNSNDELMVHSNNNNNNRSDSMVQPSSPSFSNQSSPTNKNRLEVLASEFYSSLFASGGIESNEDFEKMVYSMSGHLLSRHNSIYSQNEYSEDEGTTESTHSSFTRTNSTVRNQTNTDLTRCYPEESNRPELDILQSDLNLFKFPTTNI